MVQHFTKSLLTAAIVAAAAFAANTASAAVSYDINTVQGGGNLAGLIESDGAIVVGDKLFYNFEYTPTGDMPTANNVVVTGKIANVKGETMWGITFSGLFQDLAGGEASNATIRYSVLVLDPAKVITCAYLGGNPTVVNPNMDNTAANSYMQVTETFIPQNDTDNAVIYSYYALPENLNKFIDIELFDGKTYTAFDVQKDIKAYYSGIIGSSNMSFVDQLYCQEPNEGNVPEPASLGVLGLGALALMARRRK